MVDPVIAGWPDMGFPPPRVRRVIGGGVSVYLLEAEIAGEQPYWIAVREYGWGTPAHDPTAWDATGMPTGDPDTALASLLTGD